MGKDVETFLAHHGVKGMKWGVRKKRQSRVDTSAVNELARRKNQNIGMVDPSTVGPKKTGNPNVAMPDQGTLNKSSGGLVRRPNTAHLTDKQLQDTINRMRLDQQYAELTAPKVSPGKKWIKGLGTKLANNLQDAIAKNASQMIVTSARKYLTDAAKNRAVNKAKVSRESTKASAPKTPTTNSAPKAPSPTPQAKPSPSAGANAGKAYNKIKESWGNFKANQKSKKYVRNGETVAYREPTYTVDEDGRPSIAGVTFKRIKIR
jgi:hypothetical protein|nr:MAG TPA: hypothetical protein [Caudoviricetes sp.]